MATTLTQKELSYLTSLLCTYIEIIAKDGVTIPHLSKLHFNMATGKVTSFDANDSSFFALLIKETHIEPRTAYWAGELGQKLKGTAA